ncbi:MAG: hypothetical protein ACRBBV_13780 [Paracoccaceae bacterium]
MKNTVFAMGVALSLIAVQAMAEVNDTDGNGSYSYEEMAAAYEGMNDELFAEIDSDESGEVSVEELAVAVEAGLIDA